MTVNLSFVKDIKVIDKKTTRYGHKMDFCQLQRPFMSRKFDAPPSSWWMAGAQDEGLISN